MIYLLQSSDNDSAVADNIIHQETGTNIRSNYVELHERTSLKENSH